MSAMASQITSLTIVYSGADQTKASMLCVTGLCVGNSPATGEFPAQSTGKAENVSIWWRLHEQIGDEFRKVETTTKHGNMFKVEFVKQKK